MVISREQAPRMELAALEALCVVPANDGLLGDYPRKLLRATMRAVTCRHGDIA